MECTAGKIICSPQWDLVFCDLRKQNVKPNGVLSASSRSKNGPRTGNYRPEFQQQNGFGRCDGGFLGALVWTMPNGSPGARRSAERNGR
jgi:hypothetical protein